MDGIGALSSASPTKLIARTTRVITTPGGTHNLAFLSSSSSQPGKFTVTGVGAATPDADGDGNFENVVANGSGVIEGTWDVWSPDVWATFTALLFVQVADPVSLGTLITVR